MRVYIAGPMTGYPEYNFPAFHRAAADWRREGWEVTNPAEMDEALDGFNAKTDTAKPHEWYMRRDLPALCACDAIALLPGWERSKGCRNEVAVARMCGLEFYHADTFVRFDPTEPETILQEAQRLVHGNRGADYGHPALDFGRTAGMATAMLSDKLREGAAITRRDVGMFMILVKLSRLGHRFKRDSVVDIAGYAETLSMVAEWEAEHSA